MPSASVVVASAHAYGAVVAVQPVVQLDPPAGAYWKRTEATPEPESAAVPASVTVPRRGDPGSVIVTALGGVASAVAAALSLLFKLSSGAPPAPVPTARTT